MKRLETIAYFALSYATTVLLGLLVAYLITGLMSCTQLPPIKVCPDGTVRTRGPCPPVMPPCSAEHPCNCAETHVNPDPEARVKSCEVYLPCCPAGTVPVDVLGQPHCPRYECTPSPEPSPTATPPLPLPTPSPSSTPAPSPTPSPEPSPCVPTMPAPFPPECSTCAEKIEWELARNNWHRIPGHPGYYMEHDHVTMGPWFPGWVPRPQDVARITFALSQTCQRVRWPGKEVIYELESGWFGNVCHRQQPIPCPPPSPGPTPTPPPGPGVNDIPGACPRLDAIHLSLHNIMGPDFQPRPAPVVGGYVVIDATPQFGCGDGACFSRNRCNDEKHWICTRSGVAHETQDSEHLAAAAEDRACQNYRRCEDPNGYAWGFEGGSPGQTQHDNYQIRIGPLRAGQHRVWVSAGGGSRDHYGQPVPIRLGTLGEIVFQVH